MEEEKFLFAIDYVNGEGKKRHSEFYLRQSDLLQAAMNQHNDDAAQEYNITYKGLALSESEFDN